MFAVTEEEEIKGWEVLALYGERSSDGGKDKLPGGFWERDLCALSSASEQGHGSGRVKGQAT